VYECVVGSSVCNVYRVQTNVNHGLQGQCGVHVYGVKKGRTKSSGREPKECVGLQCVQRACGQRQ